MFKKRREEKRRIKRGRVFAGLAVLLAVALVSVWVSLRPTTTPASSGVVQAVSGSASPSAQSPTQSPSPSGGAGSQAVNLTGCKRYNYVSPTGHSVADLKPLPENTALYDAEAEAWARASLYALGAPLTYANVQTMRCWFRNEGAPHDLNNPLNLQTPHGGSTVSTADGDPPQDRIQAYPTPADFVAAFPIEMHNGSYGAIVQALMSGVGFLNSTNPDIEHELDVYSGGGYKSVPAHQKQ